jgi:hypothetical protein
VLNARLVPQKVLEAATTERCTRLRAVGKHQARLLIVLGYVRGHGAVDRRSARHTWVDEEIAITSPNGGVRRATLDRLPISPMQPQDGPWQAGQDADSTS